MTTYSYKIVFNDTEMIMLDAALKEYIRVCEKEIAENPRAPFFAHKDSAAKVLEKMRECETQMMSTSSFCHPRNNAGDQE